MGKKIILTDKPDPKAYDLIIECFRKALSNPDVPESDKSQLEYNIELANIYKKYEKGEWNTITTARHLAKRYGSKIHACISVILTQYKILPDDYLFLWINSGGICRICGTPFRKFNKTPSIDHDHKTGKVRGLLCSSCNLLLGSIEKNNIDPAAFTRYLEDNFDG